MDWLKREDKVIKEYQSLITNLVSAHPFYLRACLRMIVKNFTPSEYTLPYFVLNHIHIQQGLSSKTTHENR